MFVCGACVCVVIIQYQHIIETFTLLHRWTYSPAASSLTGMSPFPVTSPAMNVISPINDMRDLEDLIHDLGETDISFLAVCVQPV